MLRCEKAAGPSVGFGLCLIRQSTPAHFSSRGAVRRLNPFYPTYQTKEFRTCRASLSESLN